MTLNASTTPIPSRPRRLVFTVVAAVVAALFATNFLSLLAPWTGVNLDHGTDPGSHRWHHAR